MTKFPTDDVTLGILEAACIGDDEGSHLMDMLGFGSVDTGPYVHTDPETGDTCEFETRVGGYHPSGVILALIAEIRQLRASHPDVHGAGCGALDWYGEPCAGFAERNADYPPARLSDWRGVGVLLARVRTMLGRAGDRGTPPVHPGS